MRHRTTTLACLAALASAATTGAAAGQEPGLDPAAAALAAAGWDGPRALGLVERARARRQEPVLDETLRTYRADVTGHIYFFVDQRDGSEPVLLRADQVALELYWGQPDRVKQVIRGMRHEEQFPIRDFRYYLDRYTVIHDGFGDEIRVGEGRDVRNVPHPLAPGAEAVYRYRLHDSTTIRLPGQADPIRVYEIQARPRDPATPAIVGSLFIERARADLVRLAFTFTRAAYLDPRNERVEIMLENALWEGRYWLPREQRLLVRRELPRFDFDIGTVIRAALRVTDYELNIDLPAGFFAGHPVVAVAGPEGLRDHPFEEGLYDGLARVGLAPGFEPGTLGEVDVDAIAGRILREHFLRGVPPVRLHLPAASRIVRYGRAEGFATELGISIGAGRSAFVLHGGHAWGSGDPLAEIAWRPVGPPRPLRFSAEAYLNRPLDLGLRPEAAGAFASIGALFGSDYRTVLPASGVRAGLATGDARIGRLRVGLAAEAHRQADQALRTAPVSDRAFRPVAPAEDGARWFAEIGYDRRVRLGPLDATVRPALEAGWADFDEAGAFARARLVVDAAWTSADRDAGLDTRFSAAAATGANPVQHLWYLGGPRTLPGHGFHEYAGDAAAALDLVAWRDAVPRLFRVRLLAAAAWADLSVDPPAPHDPPAPTGLAIWQPRRTAGVRTSIGAGIGLIHGVLRIDYAIRTDTREGRFSISVDPRIWHLM